MSVTAETKAKRQKNGNVHAWTYYHCTKKSKTEKCLETPVRSEVLDEQLSAILRNYQMPAWLASGLRELIDKDERAEQEQTGKAGASLQSKIAQLSDKQNILLDSYLNQDIDRDIFTAKKAEIMSRKKTLEEKLEQTLRGQNAWVEPMRKWIDKAVSICKITESGDLIAKKSVLAEIFGSNLFLRNKKVVINDDKFLSPPLEKPVDSPAGCPGCAGFAARDFVCGGPEVPFLKLNPEELIADLELLYTRMVDLGFEYHDGVVYLEDLDGKL